MSDSTKKSALSLNPVSAILQLLAAIREKLGDWLFANSSTAFAIKTKLDELEEGVQRLEKMSYKNRKGFEAMCEDTRVFLTDVLKTLDKSDLDAVEGDIKSYLDRMEEFRRNLPPFPCVSDIPLAGVLDGLGSIQAIRQSGFNVIIEGDGDKTVSLSALTLPNEKGKPVLMYRMDLQGEVPQEWRNDTEYHWSSDDIDRITKRIREGGSFQEFERQFKQMVCDYGVRSINTAENALLIHLLESQKSGKEVTADNGMFYGMGTYQEFTLSDNDGVPDRLVLSETENGAVRAVYYESPTSAGKEVLSISSETDGSRRLRIDCPNGDFARKWLGQPYVYSFLQAHHVRTEVLQKRLEETLQRDHLNFFPPISADASDRYDAFKKTVDRFYSSDFNVSGITNSFFETRDGNEACCYIRLEQKVKPKKEYLISFEPNGMPTNVFEVEKGSFRGANRYTELPDGHSVKESILRIRTEMERQEAAAAAQPRKEQRRTERPAEQREQRAQRQQNARTEAPEETRQE